MPALFRPLNRVVDALITVLAVVSAVLMGVLAVLGTADVLLQNTVGRPIPAATEFASALMPMAVMLVLAQAQRQRAHIRVDIFANLLPPRLLPVLDLLALLAGVIVFAFLAWGAWELMEHSLTIRQRAVAAIRFPVWPTKIVYFAGIAFAALVFMRDLLACLAGIAGLAPHAAARAGS